MQKLAAGENFRAFGFESAAEVRAAALEEPLAVYMVQLDDLRNYRAGTDPSSLLKRLDKVVFPVSVDKRVRSSITLEERGGKWQATSFGAPALTQRLSDARSRALASHGVQPGGSFIVHVAALNAYFLGHRNGSQLMLTAIADDSELRTRAGETQPASEVFVALAEAARRYNGLPR
ncbi:MAG TPA: hypothetical protein VKB52_07905 [Rhodanobacteraceae bacterium]|nr:hypothetical protein [Rhodanobacteraceae bacterium]